MTSKVSKYTIVVAVLEGRNFPRRSGASVYVQCKFNGEQLSTDPVSIGNLGAPMWDTELAWDLDARALHYLRTNRVPIKVSVYALSPQGSRRALLGNLVLDLRAAQPFPAKEIWAPLIPPPAAEASSANWLSTTTNGPRPELKISFGSGPQGSDVASASSTFPRPVSPHGNLSLLHVSPQKSGTGANSSMVHAPPPAPRHISSIAASNAASTSLTALQIAQQSDGAYRVGTNSSPDRMFRLAVTIFSIRDLTLLAVLPSQQPQSVASANSSSPSKGYFVLMHLLGNELRTQSFTDPKSPSFLEETLTLDLVVGSSDIDALIRSLDKLPIHLCYDEQILGVALLDFPQLFLNEDGQTSPASHDCTLDVIEDSTIDLKISQRPKLAVRVALTELPTLQRLESLLNSKQGNPATTSLQAKSEVEDQQPPESPSHRLSAIERAASVPTSPHQQHKSVQPSHPPNGLPALPELPSVPIHVPSTITTLRKEYEQEHGAQTQPKANAADQIQTPALAPTVNNLTQSGLASDNTNSRWHQYRFSIDIKAARDLQPPWHSANVFFKYAYGPFGTRSPFLSHPPVPLSRNSAPTEVLLTSGFCAYEFVMAPSRLRLFLDALPLEIFAVHKDVMAKDTVLGAALVDLGRVMDATKRNTTTKAGQPLEVQVVDHWVNVCASAPSGSVVKVLAIRVIMCLEDFGPIEEQHVPASATSGAVDQGASGQGHGESVDAFANSITIPPSVTVGEDAFKMPKYPSTTATATPAAPLLLDPTTMPRPPPTDPTAAAFTFAQLQQQQQESLLWERAQQQVDEWRQRQEQRIEQAIRERDATAMKELESRLKSRESELEKKAAEYREVEMHLERLLADMERREQALQREEQDLIDRKVEMEREFESRCAKVEDTARRLDADVVDQRERDRVRLADMERQKNEAVAEKAEWERKFRALDQAFFEFKSKAAEDARGSPEARELQARLKEVSEKVDAAEKRAVVYKKQRTHFKQQWLKTLAEYAQYKRDAEQAKQTAESEVYKRLAEVRVQQGSPGTKRAASPQQPVVPVLPNVPVPTVPEPRGATRAEAEELQRIRAELDELRETHEQFKQSILGATVNSATGPGAGEHQHQQQQRAGGSLGRSYVVEPSRGRGIGANLVHGPTVVTPQPSLPRDQLLQLERIIQERDLLLRSGVYTVNDHLIREMNARIQQLEMS